MIARRIRVHAATVLTSSRPPGVHRVTDHTIAIVQVTQVLSGWQRRGGDAAPLLRRVGIAESLLASPLSRVTQAQYAALLRLLARSMRDEYWGLLSRPVPLGTLAQTCRALIHCRTLGEALQVGLRHYHGLLPDFAPRLQVGGGAALVRLTRRAAPSVALDYAERVFLFLSYGLACWLVARSVPLLDVRYRADAGAAPTSDVPRLFRAPLRFGEPHTGWSFDAAWLDLPVVQTGASLAEFLHRAPTALLVRYRDQSTLTERIRRLLRRHLDDELPTLDDIATQLAMTPQTLRRRLRDEGRGYQCIKDDLRRDAAIEYLARPELTLAEIGLRLGFSEASTFHRAFKHWTGVAPGEYRQRHRPA